MESPSPAEAQAKSRRPRRSFLTTLLWTIFIGCALYICYFTHLNALGFVGPDEPRYAWIARDMAESGDWITPRLYGKPWFEKPPLYYWSAALSFKLLGVSEASARLPSAVFALLATLAMGWLAWRIYGAETARWTLLLLPTSVGMIGFSHAAATDMPFAATLTLALVPVAILLHLIPAKRTEFPPSGSDSQESSILTTASSAASSTLLVSVLLGFFLGLATLAKGPAALILCGGGVLLWAVFTKRWRDTLGLLHPATILAFCLTALPWYILCAIRNPDFFRVFIIEHNFKRFLTPEFQHLQPFWYYAEILFIAILPWTALIVTARMASIERLRNASLSPAMYLLLSWAIFCVFFFTISRSKLPGYILPALPPLGLVLARGSTLLANSRPSRRAIGVAALFVAAIFGVAFFMVWTNSDHFLKRAALWAPFIGLTLLLFAVTNLLLGVGLLYARRSAALITAVLPFFPAFWLLDLLAPFTPLSIQSPRYLADQIKSQQLPLASLRTAKLRRATIYGLNFYLRSDLQEWDGDTSRGIYVLTPQNAPLPCAQKTETNCSDLWEAPETIGDLQLLRLKPGL